LQVIIIGIFILRFFLSYFKFRRLYFQKLLGNGGVAKEVFEKMKTLEINQEELVKIKEQSY